MNVSKYDLCKSCRETRPTHDDGTPSKFTIEEMFDKAPAGFMPMHYMVVLANLKSNGGCSNCINLLKRATGSN